MSTRKNVCNVCKRPNEEHRQPFCEFCSRPHEHHRPGDVEFEMESIAKFAKIRQDIGLELVMTGIDKDEKPVFATRPTELSKVEQKCLRKFPDPRLSPPVPVPDYEIS